MPFVTYVHAEDPGTPEDGGRAPWQPNWRIWRWVGAAIVLGLAASRTDGAVEAVLVLVVFALCCQALAEALPNGDGMREWRQ